VVGVIENEDWTPNNLDSGMLKVNEQMRYQKNRDSTENMPLVVVVANGRTSGAYATGIEPTALTTV